MHRWLKASMLIILHFAEKKNPRLSWHKTFLVQLSVRTSKKNICHRRRYVWTSCSEGFPLRSLVKTHAESNDAWKKGRQNLNIICECCTRKKKYIRPCHSWTTKTFTSSVPSKTDHGTRNKHSEVINKYIWLEVSLSVLLKKYTQTDSWIRIA